MEKIRREGKCPPPPMYYVIVITQERTGPLELEGVAANQGMIV